MRPSTPLALVLALAACKGAAAPGELPGPTSAEGGRAQSAEAGGVEPIAERAFLVRGATGELLVVRASSASSTAITSAGALVCDLGEPSVLAKLAGPAVLTRLSALKGEAQASLFVKLDPARAPHDEAARRAALAATGAAPQTLAGDVATVLVAAPHLGDLLAVPWVVAVEAPGFAVPR